MSYERVDSKEYNKIQPFIKETIYGLNNHSIFETYDGAVNCTKPISLNGSPYKGRKNKGKTHIKDIVTLPNGTFALLSKTFCNDAGIEYLPNENFTGIAERQPDANIKARSSADFVETKTEEHVQLQNNRINLNDNIIQ